MKIEISEKFYLTLHPRPAYVIGSGKFGEKSNFMAASWVTPVSEEPPRVCIAIDKESYTWELINSTGEFTVNVVSEEYTDKLYYVGTRSGREVDKIKTSGFKVVKGDTVDAPVVENAVAVLECKVWKVIDCGDTVLVIGDVLKCKADSTKFNPRYGWDLRTVKIPLHVWGPVFAYHCRVKSMRK